MDWFKGKFTVTQLVEDFNVNFAKNKIHRPENSQFHKGKSMVSGEDFPTNPC